MAQLATGFLPGPEPGRFWAVASSYRAAFDSEGIQLVRHGRKVAIRFPGALLRWRAEGEPAARLHFLGEKNRSYTGSGALRAAGAYPGVDIVVRLKEGRLKSEFQLAAGVPPSVAGYCFEGAAVQAGGDGQSLEVDAGQGWRWAEEGLESWQDSTGGKKPVRSRFRVRNACVRFELAGVDPALPLTIDPELVFSSYLGGGLYDAVTAVAVDAQGNLYLGGWTESADFPRLGAFQNGSGGRIDGFVAKVNPAGQLVYSTYLGGSNEDRVQAIAVDSGGSVTVAGLTNSMNFPVQFPARGALSGGRDAFVARLSATGNQLAFSTYLGGTAHDSALAVALDPSGNVVVGGETSSSNFPVQNAFSATSGGGADGFLARLTSSGVLLSSSYFGGASDDRIRGIAAGSDGTVHVTGSTSSSNFPVAAAPFPSLRGSMDAFYTRFHSGLTGIALSTYLGGAGGSSLSEEAGYGVAIDSTGRAWVAGVTPSADFPAVSGGFQASYGGGASDAFVSVFSPNGSLAWSTYIGGSGIDAATSVSAGVGFVGLAGYTTSNNLPVRNASQPARGGGYDAFWGAFPLESAMPLAISYLGGSGSDSALAAAATGGGLAFGGLTLSSNIALRSPIQSGNPGSYGGFVSRIQFGPGPVTVSPSSGTGSSGVFSFSVAHVNGGAAIQSSAFLFNSTQSFSGGCHITYDRGLNRLSLYKDAGDVWLTVTPGSAATIDNGVCSISGSGLSAGTAAGALTVTIPIAFSSGFAGAKRIYGNATDTSNFSAGWSEAGSWTIPAASSVPDVGTATPSSGTGLNQSFSFTFSDADGASDIATANILFNDSLAVPNGCYFSYSRAANTISLFRDSDSAMLPVTPGSSGTASNPNCSIAGTGSAVSLNGNQLTVTVPVTFSSTFGGVRTMYGIATDSGGRSSGWKTLGSWTPNAGSAPTVSGVTPDSGAGMSQTFTLTTADGNGHADISQVEFLVNATLNVTGGCYVRYQRASNSVSLLRDSDGASLPVTAGSTATVSNGNCTLSGTGLTVTGSGTSLSLALPLTFQSTFLGNKSTYGKVTDSTGLTSGWRTAGAWSVSAPSSPEVNSISPLTSSGPTQTFTVTVSDPNGNADIASVLFLANASLTTANGCHVSYNRSQNLFSLLRDSGTSWDSIAPGSSASVSNSNCTLSGAGLAANASGDSLILSLPLTARSTFTGQKNLYASVTDAGGATSNWVNRGTWSPNFSAAAPTVASLAPNAGSGSAQTFTAVLSDANGSNDVAAALFVINSSLNGNNGCYFSFSQASNQLNLFRDADNTWLPLTAGSNSSVSNDNCTISGSGFSITPNGNSLAVAIPISFKPAFTGLRRIYINAFDAGNLSSGWIQAGSWTTSGASSGPAVTSLSPASGSGGAQSFTAVFSDPNGFTDIASAGMIINTTASGANACQISFNRAANTFSLFRDSDGAWLPLTPGANATVSNANCTLSGSGLSANGSGTSLTLVLPLTFLPGFSGARNVYLMATDAGGITSGWIASGTWTAGNPAAPPVISSLSPTSGSGGAQTFTAVFSDPNGQADIVSAGMIINTSASGANGCQISFSRAANTFSLFRDSDGAWLPLTPGANATVSNNNCSLSGTGLSANGSGNSLTLVFPVTFLPAFSGAKNVYLTATDAGNLSPGWITAGTWTPSTSAAPPVVTSLSPNSGAGMSQPFTIVLSDPNGEADVAAALFVINNTLNGNNACYISFSRAANTFYLFRDQDNSWLPIVPGSSATVTNNNCTISGAGLSVAGGGSAFNIVLPLSFKPAFAGLRNFYIMAVDAGNLTSGWITSGNWRVQ